MPIRRPILITLSLAVLAMTGCETDGDAAPPIGERAGSYVLRVDSATNNADTYWGTHVARSGDTFGAVIAADGTFTVSGLRVSGYASPGAVLTPASGGYSGSATHLLNGAGDPAFFSGGSAFTVTDSYFLVDATPLRGSIGSTAVRSSPAGNLQDTLGFTLLPRPDLTGSGADRYRLTVDTRSGSITALSPVGATTDILLAADGTLTLSPDQVGEQEVALTASNAATLVGQYSIFDDTTVGNIRSVPLSLTLSGSGASRVASSMGWTVQRNTSPATVEEQYALTAMPLSFFQAFATAPPNNTYEMFGGAKSADSSIPVNWLAFVNRIVAAGDGDQTVLASFAQTLLGPTLTDVELVMDTNAPGGDTRLPIGQRTSGAGTVLTYAFVQTASDASIHSGLPTTVTFTFAYTGSSTFSTLNNASITFASTAGTGTLTYTFNPTE
jgi:hypothetical protein